MLKSKIYHTTFDELLHKKNKYILAKELSSPWNYNYNLLKEFIEKQLIHRKCNEFNCTDKDIEQDYCNYNNYITNNLNQSYESKLDTNVVNNLPILDEMTEHN